MRLNCTPINHFAHVVDAAVHNHELCHTEWRRDFVFYLDAGFVADHLIAFFDRTDTSNIQLTEE